MLHEFFIFVSHLTPFLVVIAVPLYLHYRDERDAATYLLSLGVALALTYSLKYILQIPRPEDAMIDATSPRFPSGHATLSFLLVGYFRQLKYRVPFLVYALIVTYSRLYLNVHRPVDLVAGALIGFTVPALILYYEDRFHEFVDGISGQFLER